MIVAGVVLLAWAVLLLAAWRLNVAIDEAGARFHVLTGGYGQAGLLAEAREGFRRRQRKVEQAVATGTVGIETAHRTLAHHLGSRHAGGAGFYAGIRALNSGLGRALSDLFAPKPRKHSESLAEWRSRQANKEPQTPAPDDRDREHKI